MYIALLRKKSNGNKYVPTQCAPKRWALEMFGGTLTIEEFRKNSSNVGIIMPWENHVMPTQTRARALPSAPVQQQEELVLRRPKPLPRAKSSLEASLGITRKTR